MSTWDDTWKDISVEIPTLLPLGAVPQTPDPGAMLQYIQGLHNYLAGDRMSIVRAINVLSRFRGLQSDDETDAAIAASGSGASKIQLDTGILEYDDIRQEANSGAVWSPIHIASTSVDLDTTDFDGILSATEDTLQKALDLIDDGVLPLSAGASFPLTGSLYIENVDPWLVLDHVNEIVRIELVSSQPIVSGYLYNNTGSKAPQFTGWRAGGTEATPIATSSNHGLFKLGARGHDGTEFSTSSRAQILITAGEAFTPTAQGTKIDFQTTEAGTTTLVTKLRIGTDGVVFNETGADYDTRFEGLSDANLLFLDAGNDRVGVGLAAPAAKFDVAGDSFFGDQAGGDYAEFDSRGHLVLYGAARTWDDMRVPVNATSPGSSAPSFDTFQGNTQTLVFENGKTQSVVFACQLSHKYAEGTDVLPHVHWSPDGTNTGNVKWQLEYTWASINSAFPSTTTITVLDAGSGTALDHLIAAFAAISGTSKTVSSMFQCELTRLGSDVEDTYTGDVFFHEFDFHYEVDTMGSDDEYTK